MRKLLFILLPLCILCSCDYIAPADRLIELSSGSDVHTTLLTEFSGIGCVNCPTAQDIADDLALGGNLIVVQMHPAANAFTASANPQYDYTCADADAYYLHFSGTATTPFPTGVVDFCKQDDGYFVDCALWATAIERRRQRSAPISLNATLTSDALSYTLQTTADNNSFSSANFRLIFWLVEDSVSGLQLMPDGSVSYDYVHRHLFRGALNDTWGNEHSLETDMTQQYTLDVTPYCNTGKHYSIVTVALSTDKSEVLTVTQTDLPSYTTTTDEPFVLTVNGIGAINSDTLIVVSNAHNDPITGKKEMEVRGTVLPARHLAVDVVRENDGIDDQLCLGVCINGNGEKTQTFDFNIDNDFSTWYAHLYPADDNPTTITYLFRNDARQLRLQVRYEP